MNTAHDEFLLQFFAGIFHQDWPEEASDGHQALENALGHYGLDDLMEVQVALTSMLNEKPTENELKAKLLDHWQCSYDPTAKGISMQEWFRQVADKVDAHVERLRGNGAL